MPDFPAEVEVWSCDQTINRGIIKMCGQDEDGDWLIDCDPGMKRVMEVGDLLRVPNFTGFTIIAFLNLDRTRMRITST